MSYLVANRPCIGAALSKLMRCLHLLWTALFAVLCSLPTAASAQGNGTDGDKEPHGAEVNFARDIRPLLSDRCFLCHGPDAGQRASDLRLDHSESAHDAAIVPGDSSASELIERIFSDDEDFVMPPPDSNLSLSGDDKALLTRWIDQGGKYEEHWAWAPPTKSPLPEVSQAGWSHGAIDRFVLSRLESAKLAPSPEADKRTLIRRLSFDLTGLPPTPEEVQAFVADTKSGSYERLVDDLLSRTSFGERWATEWLDVARYADTYGYQNDRYREMWPWRDWVVRSFNENLPYDDFIQQQIAGDLLPDATEQTILATAFNRNHRQTNEGGSVEEEYRAEYVADRVNTFGAAFLGLTLECCRCHDHKYDPLSQRDYYSLAAYFNSIDESGLYSHFTEAVPTPTLRLPSESEEEKVENLAKRVDEAQAKVATASTAKIGFDDWRASLADVRPLGGSTREPNVSVRELLDSSVKNGLVGDYSFDDIEASGVPNAADDEQPAKLSGSPKTLPGKVGKALKLDGENGITFETGSQFSRGDPFTISLWLQLAERYDRAVIFHRSRAWTDSGSRGYELLVEDGKLSAGLIHFWPGNAIRVLSDKEMPVGKWLHVTLAYDGSSKAAGLTLSVNGSPVRTDVVRDKLTKTIGGSANKLVIGNRFRDKGFKNGAIDQFRVYDRCLTPLETKFIYLNDAKPDNVAELLHNASTRQLREYFLAHDPQVQEATIELQTARTEMHAAEDGISEIMVMRELPNPRPTYVLLRGAYDSPGAPVNRGLPQELTRAWRESSENASGTPDRRELARWLISPTNPLASRVAVNRFWQALFGQGIVSTSEDFGMQGEAPSHPRLLDYMAVEFVESSWNVKQLLKRIVMSATYRQSSDPRPELLVQDPQNRLLARGATFRLSAEMLRDSSLLGSGLLVDQIGGPPVKPYQPDGLWKEKSGLVYKRDANEGSWRRSIYTYWKRTSPPPSMMTFDASSREVCTVRRQVTSTPMQTLVLLNDPQFVEAARGIAVRARAENTDPSQSLACVFEIMTSRPPSENETAVLKRIYDGQLSYFASSPDAAKKFLAIGDYRADVSGDEKDGNNEKDTDSVAATAQLAALTAVASGLFTYDEVVTKR